MQSKGKSFLLKPYSLHTSLVSLITLLVETISPTAVASAAATFLPCYQNPVSLGF